MKIVNRLFLFVLCLFPLILCEGKEISEIPYERFVSLGNCCVTRTQINYHLHCRFGIDPYSFGGGQLFDWLLMHDYDKLSEAIENDLNDLFERSDLFLVSWSEIYRCVKNFKYNMSWNHLFTRNPDLSIADNIIDLEYDLRKAKIDYLSTKFRDLSKFRTLYIITYPFENYPDCLEPTQTTLLRLSLALEKLRGNNNFDILYCPLEKKFDDFHNIYIRTMYIPPETNPVIGDYENWNLLLTQFPFKREENILLLMDDVIF